VPNREALSVFNVTHRVGLAMLDPPYDGLSRGQIFGLKSGKHFLLSKVRDSRLLFDNSAVRCPETYVDFRAARDKELREKSKVRTAHIHGPNVRTCGAPLGPCGLVTFKRLNARRGLPTRGGRRRDEEDRRKSANATSPPS
jgi:hypothetical protein